MANTRVKLPAGTVLHFNGVALKTAEETDFSIDNLNVPMIEAQLKLVRQGLTSGEPALNENAELRQIIANQTALLERVNGTLEKLGGDKGPSPLGKITDSEGSGDTLEPTYPFPENFANLSGKQAGKWYKENNVNPGWSPSKLPENFESMAEPDRWAALEAAPATPAAPPES